MYYVALGFYSTHARDNRLMCRKLVDDCFLALFVKFAKDVIE